MTLEQYAQIGEIIAAISSSLFNLCSAAADPDGHGTHGAARWCVLAVDPLLSSGQSSLENRKDCR